jgi:hypothetical protein
MLDFVATMVTDFTHIADLTTTIANVSMNTSVTNAGTLQQYSTDVAAVTADTVLNAWAQQWTEKGAVRAQPTLEGLEEVAIHSGRSSSCIRVTARTYATVKAPPRRKVVPKQDKEETSSNRKVAPVQRLHNIFVPPINQAVISKVQPS